MFVFPYRWTWRTAWKNVRYNWYVLRGGIRNIRDFGSAVWFFDACDYSHTLEVMEVAMRRMRDLHRDHGVTVSAPKMARQLTICAELCRRLREDEYFERAGFDHRAWGTFSAHKKCRLAKHATEMAKQDAIYLGRMFKFVQHWWD